MLTRRAVLVGSAVAGAGLAAGVARAAEPFKLGVISPFSGPFALYGGELARGYALAADEINAKGGLLGRTVTLVRGDAGTPQQAIAAVGLLTDSENVDALIGCYLSPVAIAASDAAAQAGKLYWETNALADKVTSRGLTNVVRAGPDTQRFAERSVDAVVKLVAPALGKSPTDLRVFLEHEDSEWGTSMFAFHKKDLEQAGVKLVAEGVHSIKSIDFTDSILRVQAAKPDLWLTLTYVPMNNLLLKTARDQGFAPPATMLVGTGDTPETLQAVGARTLEGVLVVGYPRPEQSDAYGPGASAFLAAYRKTYGQDPIAPQGMTAYVGAKLLFAAVAGAGSADPDAVRAFAAKVDQPESTTATGFGVKYDADFQNVRAFPTVAQWQNGVPVTVFPDAARRGGAALVGLARS